MKKSIFLILFLAAAASVCFNSCEDIHSPSDPPNILFIVADDVGRDGTPGYPEGAVKPTVPNFSNLMDNGLRFTNFWSNPTCSPTRASAITGKYGFRTDVLFAQDELSEDETILHQYIADGTGGQYSTGLIGKWHLSGNDLFYDPETRGMDHYEGLIIGASTYKIWPYTQDGATAIKNTYITEDLTDMAIDWIGEQDKPWFLWMAYTAAHTPFHAPPANMHSQGDLDTTAIAILSNPQPYYMAMIEAMDFQIGRLLNSIPPKERENTVIIFIGDNGTSPLVVQAPYSSDKAKGSLYEGGINVPLIISGPNVRAGETEDAMLHATDIFATIARLSGIDITQIHDSYDFSDLLYADHTGPRRYNYADNRTDGVNLQRCIRNSQFKLIVFEDGRQELYDLINDPYESDDLILGSLSEAASQAKIELEAELEAIIN
jgi:arylsulfatase A-like enzyme